MTASLGQLEPCSVAEFFASPIDCAARLVATTTLDIATTAIEIEETAGEFIEERAAAGAEERIREILPEIEEEVREEAAAGARAALVVPLLVFGAGFLLLRALR